MAHPQLASFSNYGEEDVDLGAPGDNILHLDGGAASGGDGGHASGAGRRPSYSDLSKAIRNNVSALPALTGKTYTNGQLNVAAAFAAVK